MITNDQKYNAWNYDLCFDVKLIDAPAASPKTEPSSPDSLGFHESVLQRSKPKSSPNPRLSTQKSAKPSW